MPILEPDPWRKQFFEFSNCPKHVFIPTKDTDAYKLNPAHNWVYNKLLVTEKQFIPCGPHGTIPSTYPIFSKPIYNLRSMGAGIEVFTNHKQYSRSLKPGHMWSELLTGDHYSTDAAIHKGKVVWLCHTKGIPLENGTFDYWEIKENSNFNHYLVNFIEKYLGGYTGMLNLETIGSKIIEIHLRFADQWPDLYGKWFIHSLIDLYTNRNFTAYPITNMGYSVVLFSEPRLYKKPSKEFIDELLKINAISSIQLPFYEGVLPAFHSMPPGGFRIAIVNGFNLKTCKNVREKIRIKLYQT